MVLAARKKDVDVLLRSKELVKFNPKIIGRIEPGDGKVEMAYSSV